jgi:hypothetical protein
LAWLSGGKTWPIWARYMAAFIAVCLIFFVLFPDRAKELQ